MKKILALLLIVFCITAPSQAQFNRYIIRFKDKGSNPYAISNPSAYLSQRAINRRTRYNIPVDSTDLPVTPRYIDSILSVGNVTLLNVSKWLNAITIYTTDAAALAKINSFPFVAHSATAIAARMYNVQTEPDYKSEEAVKTANKARQARTFANFYNYGLSTLQITMHNGEFLHNIGLRGQDIIIGMLDGGYKSYQTLRAFDSARANGQILDTWDFVAREVSVNEDDAHGMQCFSVIAANIPGSFVGAAPKASFFLYRTEDGATEFPIEEHNWVCGAERVDSAGGDMISSSLGYSDGMTDPSFDHTYAEMNGNTTIAARGADLAAKKGILVVNAAGNQGNESFKRISTPADGDSVMAVGAVNSQRFAASFTSLGPSSDGQVKPDVASLGVGTTIQTTGNTVGTNTGTSFAAPNIAGLSACLWQGFPEFNNIKILNAIRMAGHRFTNPNDSVGYGIPDMKKAMFVLLKDFSSASATASNCKATINFSSKDVEGMRYEIERKTSTQNNFIKVGEVQGTGTLFGAKNYQFADTLINVPTGNISYRIRQVIDTSATGFSADYIDTINIVLINSCLTTSVPQVNNAEHQWLLLPNPASSQVIVRMTSINPVAQLHIMITDAKGRQVAVLQKSKPSGVYDLPLEIAQLAMGEYYISIFDGNKSLGTKPLIKL